MARTEGRPMVRRGEPEALEGQLDETAGMSAGMVRTAVAYTTAVRVQVPRALGRVERATLEEAARMGEDWFYSWQVRDKHSPTGFGTVEGTSVDGAMVLLRNFSNVACPVRVADENVTHWYLEATFIDLESGQTLQRLFRQRKSQGRGDGLEAERQQDIAFQIGQSKAQRNVILKALPAWLIKAAMEEAKRAAAEGIGPKLPGMIAAMIAAFAALKVDEAALCRRAGKPRSAWGPADVVTLRAVYRAIRDGESNVGNEFPAPDIHAPGTMPAMPAPVQAAQAPDAPAGTAPAKAVAPVVATPPAAPAVKPPAAALCKHDILRSDCPDPDCAP